MPEVIDVVRVAANLFSAGPGDDGAVARARRCRPSARTRDVQQRLRDDHELIPGFVEECLRFESPVKGDFRLSRTAVNVGGVDIPAGTTVMVLNGAAGRDPRRFDEPNEFRMDRVERQGAPGVRAGAARLPGRAAGRAETRISIAKLLERMGDIRISEAAHGPAGARRYDYVPTYILRGLMRLQSRVHARRLSQAERSQRGDRPAGRTRAASRPARSR